MEWSFYSTMLTGSIWVFYRPGGQEIVACRILLSSDGFGKPASLLFCSEKMPLVNDWSVQLWVTGDPLEMKAASRIMKNRIAKRSLLWLFKKEISGLLPLIMLFD